MIRSASGEDGPTHQPVEHLASLRAMPNLHVFARRDTMETAECWELAHAPDRRAQPAGADAARRVPALRTDAGGEPLRPRRLRAGRGGRAAPGDADRHRLRGGDRAWPRASGWRHEGIAVAVVSLPCWELFELQDEAYRAEVLGGAPRIGIEAACGVRLGALAGRRTGCFIGMTGFGASGPCEDAIPGISASRRMPSLAVGQESGSEPSKVQQRRN